MVQKPSASRNIDHLAIASLLTVISLVTILVFAAYRNPATQALVGGAIVGIGSGGLILFRQLRKAARSLIASEATALYAATHDALTQLPNRAMFVEHISGGERSLSGADCQSASVILCICLDRFRDLGDSLCFAQCDEVIRQAAARIGSLCREDEILARFGDDLFAMRCEVADRATAETLAGSILTVLAPPCGTSSGPVFVTASIGLSFNISQNRNALEILSEAQTSLSHAIGLGGNRFCFFEVGMDTASKARKSLEIELRRDVAAEALQMVYQPQINAKGIMTGVEALMRWPRPGQGQVSPSVFVPLAERCGLSSALGLFALKHAFSDSRRWPELTVAVNVSALQIREELVQTLKSLLSQTGADPHQIEIEITEGVLLNEQPETKQTLDNIRKLGFTIALDDFGTGYSSLSYLRRFPIDKIKIDQSFVAQLGKQPESSAIIKAIIEMGAALDLKIIAEGVETAAQAQSLSVLGCSLYQGYLFSCPIEADAIDGLILQPAKVAA
jgi:diguanylate cyclase (GGDEF)-like protein